MKNVLDILEARGFVDAVTSEGFRQAAEHNKLTVYCGFDPTADSLHVGNMIPIMGLAWFQRCGHTPIAIVGGATGMIGDPSERSKERQLLDAAAIDKNLAGIKKNLQSVLGNDVKLVNNLDWYAGMSCIDFLRHVGKHFRIGSMLAKDSVKSRMQSEEGMSFTEFSYQILQAYDFWHLYKQFGVTVQLGGSDQWGNITAGTELIRRLEGSETKAYGVTFPLLTRSDGQKFGKSAEGAIWMSPEKLSPFAFYQYFIRVPDLDVIKMMKLLTFMDLEEIEEIERSMSAPSYVSNTAQKRLAEEVTRIVHGEEGVKRALLATKGAAPGKDTELNAEVLESIAADIPFIELQKTDVIGQKLIDVLVIAGLQPSKGEARRLIKNGGVYLNNQKVDDEAALVQVDDLIEGRLLLLATGKKTKKLVRLT